MRHHIVIHIVTAWGYKSAKTIFREYRINAAISLIVPPLIHVTYIMYLRSRFSFISNMVPKIGFQSRSTLIAWISRGNRRRTPISPTFKRFSHFGGYPNGLLSSEYGHVGYHWIGNFKENNFGHLNFSLRGLLFEKNRKKLNLTDVRAPQKKGRWGTGVNFPRYTPGDPIQHIPEEKPLPGFFSLLKATFPGLLS